MVRQDVKIYFKKIIIYVKIQWTLNIKCLRTKIKC